MLNDFEPQPQVLNVVLVAVLLLSAIVVPASCDEKMYNSSPTDNLIGLDKDGKIITINSYDLRKASSLSDTSLLLLNSMENSLTQNLDGSIVKSQKIVMFSAGSELLKISELSALNNINGQGAEFSALSDRSITIKDCDFPFAVISEKLTTLSPSGLGIDNTESNMKLLMPELPTDDEMNAIINALGKSSNNIDIVRFNNTMDDIDLHRLFADSGIDLSEYFEAIDLQMFFEPVRNEEAWAALYEAAKRKQAEESELELKDYYLSSGGVECVWGYQDI